ncbi:MAG TPA: tetratricopeptide repeat protein [Abditibacteriaceae bacterium]|jgi:tetratricopeptide (TPR) repeat protein
MDPNAPNAFIYGPMLALGGLLTAVPVLLLLRSWMDGALDAPFAVCAIFAVLLLTGFTLAASTLALMFLCLGMQLAVCLVMPFALEYYNKRLHQQIDDADIAKYIEALHRDSHNSGAHALLGEAYLKKERYTEAVAHFEAAITISPDPERNPQLTKWMHRLKVARREKAEWEARNAARKNRKISF